MKKKILFGLLALGVLLACMPAGLATPAVAPADPNAIQLYLQQTAAAALTQTQAAIPTLPATLTFTPTPPPTFTLEPTFTPVGTIIFAPPTQSQRVQYFRVKHDHQLALYDFRSRTVSPNWAYNKQTPEILPMYPIRKESAGTIRTPVDGGWERFIDDLNGNDKGKLVYLKSSGTALFNGAGFPQMESLTMGGNIITLEAISDGWGRVHTMDYNNPGNALVENYFTRPDLVHKFVLVSWNTETKSTFWPNTPKGDIYYPFVTRKEVWVQMDRLEPFPVLPMTVSAVETQDVRIEPKVESELTNTKLEAGKTATIIQYSPSGSVVWGQLQSGGWVLLFSFTEEGPTYFTTWSMATLPPNPPTFSE
jgi:hypothetical protein